MVVVYHNLLTLLKQVRRSGEILQRYGKDQNRSRGSTDLPFLASQKLILASQQGYFPDLNRLTQSVSIFSKDNYTPALPINSPPEAYEDGGAQAEARTERDG